MPMAWKNLALLYERGLGVEKDAQQAQKYFALAARENVPGAAEGLERLSGQPAAKPVPGHQPAHYRRFPAGPGSIFGHRTMGWRTLGAAVQRGVHPVLPSQAPVFILCKVNQRQPQLPKPLRILYIVLGALLVLAGILVLLSLPGSGEPITAEDYWLVGCVLLGGGALLYRAMGKKNKA